MIPKLEQCSGSQKVCAIFVSLKPLVACYPMVLTVTKSYEIAKVYYIGFVRKINSGYYSELDAVLLVSSTNFYCTVEKRCGKCALSCLKILIFRMETIIYTY